MNFSLIVGVACAALSGLNVVWAKDNYYDYFIAVYFGLASIYWFMRAALQNLLDTIISKMVVQAFPMPMDPPKNYFDTTDKDN